MAANDLDDDILEQLKSMNNLLERIAASTERTDRAIQQMVELYNQAVTRSR